MKIKRIGVDLAKYVFQLHGVDCKEQVVLQRRLERASWLKMLLDKIEPGCEIGMEAFWAACSIPGSLIGLARPVASSTTITVYFTADGGGRSTQ